MRDQAEEHEVENDVVDEERMFTVSLPLPFCMEIDRVPSQWEHDTENHGDSFNCVISDWACAEELAQSFENVHFKEVP